MQDMPEIGRNDPCHCGSGRKYKRCCYRKDREAATQSQRNAAQEAMVTSSSRPTGEFEDDRNVDEFSMLDEKWEEEEGDYLADLLMMGIDHAWPSAEMGKYFPGTQEEFDELLTDHLVHDYLEKTLRTEVTDPQRLEPLIERIAQRVSVER